MTSDKLKDKLQKKEAELRELKKQAREAELAEQKANENLAKLEAKKDEIRDAVQAVLDQAGMVLPSGKSITITPSKSFFNCSFSRSIPLTNISYTFKVTFSCRRIKHLEI